LSISQSGIAAGEAARNRAAWLNCTGGALELRGLESRRRSYAIAWKAL